MVGTPEDWTDKAITLATNELENRKVNPKKITTAKYLSKKKKKLKANEKANKSYSIFDFVFSPLGTLIEILFSWELKKDGFQRKAKQQKYFRIFFTILLLIIVIAINAS